MGITGAKGAGKGEVAQLLHAKGFEVFSMGDLVRKEAKERGVEPTRENLQKLGTELSEKEGEDFVIKRILSKIKENKNYAVEGFRFIEDITPFKKRKDFFLIGVEAPLDVRWKRIEARKRIDDSRAFEEFKEFDLSENTSEFGQNVAQCLELADFIIVNNGSLKELDEKLVAILEKIKC